MHLNTLFACLVLAWDELCIHFREAANLAKVLVLKLILVHNLASEHDRSPFSSLDLFLLFLLSLSDENLKLLNHMLVPLHEVKLARCTFFLKEFPNCCLELDEK